MSKEGTIKRMAGNIAAGMFSSPSYYMDPYLPPGEMDDREDGVLQKAVKAAIRIDEMVDKALLAKKDHEEAYRNYTGDYPPADELPEKSTS